MPYSVHSAQICDNLHTNEDAGVALSVRYTVPRSGRPAGDSWRPRSSRCPRIPYGTTARLPVPQHKETYLLPDIREARSPS